MARLRLKTMGLVMALAIAGGACNRPSPPTSTDPDCRAIAHDLGKTEVCGQPQKVVTIGPNLLELLLALEVQPIAHAEYFPFPTPQFDHPEQQIPYLGKLLTGQPKNVGTAESPSLEAIAKLKPDLILADSIKNKDEYKLLSKIAPTLLFDYSGAGSAWQPDLQALGQALQKADKATAVVADAQQQVAKLKAKFQPIVAKDPKVLLLLSEQLSQGVRLETANSACGTLLEDVGFQVVVPAALNQSPEPSHVISLESLTNLDMDWILIEGFSSQNIAKTPNPEAQQVKAIKKEWNENAIAQSLPASKAGKVYFTPVYLCHALLGPIGTEIFLSDLYQQLSPSEIKTSHMPTRFKY
ncbi:iron-siderophore ABC transporter substrate-binding protein [Acaryochloris sp. 'Moss Beach']|uniref:ABC transporter substrate-binding protein n=1 Tax=Acaryochloris sp. 'Moss Beach' TaxID=2740837 RepID=UPI001F3CD30D|nr:iron-siderophore ABC transporter substrate-binding protein [Acaryochloris sp. 'Moss Beach']UJB67755.1 iron-siderophore ABC transporter substrate-binding protein [Acaryochloris sp. 'Moss Beach']